MAYERHLHGCPPICTGLHRSGRENMFRRDWAVTAQGSHEHNPAQQLQISTPRLPLQDENGVYLFPRQQGAGPVMGDGG